VTPLGARNYGVVINADLTADVAATARLRAKLAAERGPVPLFDRGFTSIESLKERCKAETGLEAPQQPRFSERVLKSAGVAKKKTKAA
jgi:N-methylhydantoinase B